MNITNEMMLQLLGAKELDILALKLLVADYEKQIANLQAQRNTLPNSEPQTLKQSP